jgi:hypothetical protein
MQVSDAAVHLREGQLCPGAAKPVGLVFADLAPGKSVEGGIR